MKTIAVLAGAALASSAMARPPYIDALFDTFDNGFAHLDIDHVDVSNTATHITFDITLRGDINATNWGKYCIGINTGAPGADTTNGWGRNVSWGGQAINYWIGTWADGGSGGEVRQMTGANNGSNNLMDATYNGGTQMTVTSIGTHQIITFSRASIGFVTDGTLYFDVLSTGGTGNDPGVDHLSRSTPATSGWGETSVAGQFLAYTIPTPGSMGLIGVAGLAAMRRRR